MLDQAKKIMQVMKLKKEVENGIYELEENGIKMSIGGFMAMGEPKFKTLLVNGIENRALLEAINKALKKAAEGSMRKMKDNSDLLQG